MPEQTHPKGNRPDPVPDRAQLKVQRPEPASEQTGPEEKRPDPFEFLARAARLVERSQRLNFEAATKQATEDGFTVPDPMIVGGAFMKAAERMMLDPAGLVDAQMRLWRDHTALMQTMTRRWLGEDARPLIEPERGDRRFKDKDWDENPWFNYLKQAYLLNGRWLQTTMGQVEGLDKHTRRKVEFYTRQLIDALAPTNFPATNPKVLRTALETNGENLLKGWEHLVEDLERGGGRLQTRMTDLEAFEIGKNVATTPGKVIFQNELMQLIQYNPTTETVYRRPLLIVPPWINKFYILDLQPKNSFIKWAVDQGLTVFIVSWVNPDASLGHKTFDDYMLEGTLAALDAVEQATGEREINVIGYCIGGTLTSCTLAYMAVKKDNRVPSVTYFTTTTDFHKSGDLLVFVDDEQLDMMERHMQQKGYLEPHHMATVFNMMRANDLIWSFYVNNYLLGQEPFPFDLLFWNSDSTGMPAAMHGFYLRSMYRDNLLVKPGGVSLAGVPIDLRKIKVPSYILAAREDHIAPWKSAYPAAHIYSGPVRFVLAASGHIAGVVNPPASRKYGYWTNDDLPEDPDAWFADAEAHAGSWWPDWAKWVAQYAGDQVPARQPGEGKLKPIEDAPGSYVKVRRVG